MNSIRKMTGWFWLIFSGLAIIHLLGGSALASEGSGSWRAIYDPIMLWVNFIILASIIVKFGKAPLMTFLRSQKEMLAKEIERIEDQKAAVEEKSREVRQTIDEGDAHISRIKVRITAQGETEKERIISEAKQQSQFMLEDAKKRIESHIIQAQQTFRSELVDEAINLAMKKLPNEISEDDNQALLNNYLTEAK
jgi:F-type H+-transporting ATPase subunit b